MNDEEEPLLPDLCLHLLWTEDVKRSVASTDWLSKTAICWPTEIDRPPGPEMDNCVDRESYSLSAGLALGLATLGQDGQMVGLADLRLADTLYHFMVRRGKRIPNGPVSPLRQRLHVD